MISNAGPAYRPSCCMEKSILKVISHSNVLTFSDQQTYSTTNAWSVIFVVVEMLRRTDYFIVLYVCQTVICFMMNVHEYR